MRQCSYCGSEYDDSALKCPLDGTSLDASATNSTAPESSFRITPAGKISFIAGLVGNGAIVVICLSLLILPRGAIVRGATWSVPTIAIASCVFIAGLPTALVSFRRCSRWVSLTGLLLSVSAWPLSLLLVNLITTLRDLHMGP